MADAIDERDVFTAVYRDMAEREVVGWQNHGKPLLADDGRDWLQEAYEECLDMAVYLKARLMERRFPEFPRVLAPLTEEQVDAVREVWAERAKAGQWALTVVADDAARPRPWWRWWR